MLHYHCRFLKSVQGFQNFFLGWKVPMEPWPEGWASFHWKQIFPQFLQAIHGLRLVSWPCLCICTQDNQTKANQVRYKHHLLLRSGEFAAVVLCGKVQGGFAQLWEITHHLSMVWIWTQHIRLLKQNTTAWFMLQKLCCETLPSCSNFMVNVQFQRVEMTLAPTESWDIQVPESSWSVLWFWRCHQFCAYFNPPKLPGLGSIWTSCWKDSLLQMDGKSSSYASFTMWIFWQKELVWTGKNVKLSKLSKLASSYFSQLCTAGVVIVVWH